MQKNDNVYFYEDYRNENEKKNNDSYYNDFNEYNGYRVSENRLRTSTHPQENTGYINNYSPPKNVHYDDDGYGNEDYPEYKEANKKNKIYKTPKQTLILMQIISCALIIGGILAFKNFMPQYYTIFCNWYNTEINKSLVAGEGTENYNIIESAPQSSTLSQTTNRNQSEIGSKKLVDVNLNNNQFSIYYI